MNELTISIGLLSYISLGALTELAFCTKYDNFKIKFTVVLLWPIILILSVILKFRRIG